MTGRCPECNHKGYHAAFCRAGIDESKPYHGPMQPRPQTSAERYFSLGIGDGDVCAKVPADAPTVYCTTHDRMHYGACYQCAESDPPDIIGGDYRECAHCGAGSDEHHLGSCTRPEVYTPAYGEGPAMTVTRALAEAQERGLNPKDLVGAVKSPLGLLPWTALTQVAKVFQAGAAKYGAYNWRTPGQPVQHVTYVEAAFRHLAAYMDGQTLDPETGCNHLAHAACGLLILLDASAIGNSIDNRPTPGLAAEIMKLA